MIEAYTKAEREEGFNHRHIGECCIGIAKTHKKYKWMYYEDYILTNSPSKVN